MLAYKQHYNEWREYSDKSSFLRKGFLLFLFNMQTVEASECSIALSGLFCSILNSHFLLAIGNTSYLLHLTSYILILNYSYIVQD